ncbi:MAG: sulfite exporter TauE/SafE family protein [Thermoplasmata archaeon]|nr:sulfite exporter TauE/SafE family protein [Thermoplasmata archaeon]
MRILGPYDLTRTKYIEPATIGYTRNTLGGCYLLLVDLLLLILFSILIGVIASLLGIGGGVFLVPVMTLAFGIEIKVAAATSLVTVIVTSSTSTSRYLKEGFININLGVFIEFFSIIGAVVGAVIAFQLQAFVIEAIFATVLLYTAYYMWRVKEHPGEKCSDDERQGGLISKRSIFNGKYLDDCSGQMVEYGIVKPHIGAGAGFIAGNLSGLIGVGGGIVNVPAMNVLMGVPMKAASATSNFIIGVTAVAGALLYLSNDLIAPLITAAASIGVFIGAIIGTKYLGRIRGGSLRIGFSILLVVISIMMFLRAGGWL